MLANVVAFLMKVLLLTRFRLWIRFAERQQIPGREPKQGSRLERDRAKHPSDRPSYHASSFKKCGCIHGPSI